MRIAHRPERGIDYFPTVTKEEERTASSEKDIVQTIAQVNPNFQVTSIVFHMDVNVVQKPLKDLAQKELVMARISIKAL
jgi:hypothetical protein